jgi:hypothetical protein
MGNHSGALIRFAYRAISLLIIPTAEKDSFRVLMADHSMECCLGHHRSSGATVRFGFHEEYLT